MSTVKVTTHYHIIPSEFPEDIPVIFELDSPDVKIRIGFVSEQQWKYINFSMICELAVGPWLPIMFMRSTIDMEFGVDASTEEAQHILEMEIAKLGVLVMYKLQRELMNEGLLKRPLVGNDWHGLLASKEAGDTNG